ncbi:hypothetical protein ACAG25_13855 [Mycobacterium sp. pV006]|uniref:hypothetical protein n=1 Tax=Mycobacterium sp. pV006 TaxID=3238983 RepID=UPI00351BE337
MTSESAAPEGETSSNGLEVIGAFTDGAWRSLLSDFDAGEVDSAARAAAESSLRDEGSAARTGDI